MMTLRPKDKGPVRLAQAGSEEDGLRRMVEQVVQGALEAEFEQFIGAPHWGRAEGRKGWRNGHKPRQWRTRVGSLQLLVPKDRAGRFQPSLFARYQRSEKALVLALMEMYVKGVSTRKVTDIIEELCGLSVSASHVSSLVKRLDAELAAWRTRSLTDKAYPYLMVDAHYEKVRRDGHVRSTAVLWVIGVSEDGYREHLGVWTGPSESTQTWSSVFDDLLKRGLRGVRLVVSDEHRGLLEALERYLPGCAHQRCQVHYMRNVMAHAPSPERFHQAKAALHHIWSAGDRDNARERVRHAIAQLDEQSPKLARFIEETVEETLAVYELPTSAEQFRLKSTNAVEHDHAEIRRRTRVVRIFPSEESLVRLATALAVERNEQWSQARYLTLSEDAKLQRTWSRYRHPA
jgi:transposase-like protein